MPSNITKINAAALDKELLSIKPEGPWLYKKVTSECGAVYYYATNVPNQGDHIWAETANGRGLDGSSIDLHLLDGTMVSLVGPWHSEADVLYSATGVDLRQKRANWFVVADSGAGDGLGHNTYENVHYVDEHVHISALERGMIKAQFIANELGHMVCLYFHYQGGSLFKWVSPLTKGDE